MQIDRTKFTVPQLARKWGVDKKKVYDWIDSGQLIAMNGARDPNSERPRFLIDIRDIEAFEKARQVVPASAPPRVRRKRLPEVKSYV